MKIPKKLIEEIYWEFKLSMTKTWRQELLTVLLGHSVVVTSVLTEGEQKVLYADSKWTKTKIVVKEDADVTLTEKKNYVIILKIA